MVDILLEIDKDGYKPFVVKKRQWQALHVCRVSESNIWNTKCSTIILDQAKRCPDSVGVLSQPLRLVCNEQDGEWKAVYYTVAFG